MFLRPVATGHRLDYHSRVMVSRSRNKNCKVFITSCASSGEPSLPTTHDPGTSRLHVLLTILLLLAGMHLFVRLDTANWADLRQYQVFAIAVLLAILPQVHQRLWAVMERSRHLSRRTVALTAWGLVLAAMVFFYVAALREPRSFRPIWHDEYSTIIQAQMFAHGHLCMPAHPLNEFFDTFHILVQPAYASIYFPGAAMLYVPGIWLGLPPWAIPLLLAAGAVGLIFRIFAEILDAPRAILGALLMLGNRPMRMLCLMSLNQLPMLVLGLLSIWAFLNWRRRRHWGWALTIGLISGWAMVTRPLDALYFVMPVGLAMLADLYRSSWQCRAIAIGLGIAGTLPFVSLQLAINHGISGHWFTTPYNIEIQRECPQLALGFHQITATNQILPELPQKRDFMERSVIPKVNDLYYTPLLASWWKNRLPMLLIIGGMTSAILLIFLPAGLLGLRARGLWVVWMALPGFVGLYSMYAMYQIHYMVMAVPAIILTALLGAGVIAQTIPRLRPMLTTMTFLIIGAMAVDAMARTIQRGSRAEIFSGAFQANVDRALESALGNQNALVLFRYAPAQAKIHYDHRMLPDNELVYNWHDPYPDDARVIRAHDRGDDNIRLYRYYARMGDAYQKRRVFLFDRAEDINAPHRDGKTLEHPDMKPNPRYLGTIAELAQPQ